MATRHQRLRRPRPRGRGGSSTTASRVAWEGWDGVAWQPLVVVTDETSALTLTGSGRGWSSARSRPTDRTAPEPGYWWLRCRLVSGTYECPPQLDAVAINAVSARSRRDGGRPRGARRQLAGTRWRPTASRWPDRRAGRGTAPRSRCSRARSSPGPDGRAGDADEPGSRCSPGIAAGPSTALPAGPADEQSRVRRRPRRSRCRRPTGRWRRWSTGSAAASPGTCHPGGSPRSWAAAHRAQVRQPFAATAARPPRRRPGAWPDRELSSGPARASRSPIGSPSQSMSGIWPPGGRDSREPSRLSCWTTLGRGHRRRTAEVRRAAGARAGLPGRGHPSTCDAAGAADHRAARRRAPTTCKSQSPRRCTSARRRPPVLPPPRPRPRSTRSWTPCNGRTGRLRAGRSDEACSRAICSPRSQRCPASPTLTSWRSPATARAPRCPETSSLCPTDLVYSQAHHFVVRGGVKPCRGSRGLYYFNGQRLGCRGLRARAGLPYALSGGCSTAACTRRAWSAGWQVTGVDNRHVRVRGRRRPGPGRPRGHHPLRRPR